MDKFKNNLPTDTLETKLTIGHEQRNKTDNTSPNTNKQVVDISPPTVSEPEGLAVLNKKVINKFMFLISVIILLVGVVAYFVVIPNIYGQIVPLSDWLFGDTQNIVDTLNNPEAVLPKINSIIGMRIFWWGWLTGLTASLFFVGKQLQAKPEPDVANAILTKKEPYLLIQDVNDALKQIKLRKNSKQLDYLIYAVKKLEEKLSVESDFGYGENSVINCENNIARQIQFLLDIVPYVENGDFDQNLNAMNAAVTNINSLLRRRIELKKR